MSSGTSSYRKRMNELKFSRREWIKCVWINACFKERTCVFLQKELQQQNKNKSVIDWRLTGHSRSALTQGRRLKLSPLIPWGSGIWGTARGRLWVFGIWQCCWDRRPSSESRDTCQSQAEGVSTNIASHIKSWGLFSPQNKSKRK